MDNWDKILPRRIKVLKMYSFVIYVMVILEVILWGLIVSNFEMVPSDFLIYVKWVTLFVDIALAYTTIKFINKNYPDKAPSIKQQYLFIWLLYFSIFELVIYLGSLFQFSLLMISLNEFLQGFIFSKNLLFSILIVLFIFFKTILLILLQTGSFKLVKEIRFNSKNNTENRVNYL
jgi:hypothetical protein